jgi:glycosyltransferase involved in cell wall biosynthesis
MRVLAVHNKYQQAGGEDQAFEAETALLAENGHEVRSYNVHNDQLEGMGRLESARVAVWNRSNYRELRSIIREEQPEVVHFHNIFPLISPAGYYAAKSEGVPVVQSLHNYRLICPNALFFRQGHACEDCQGKLVPWPGVLHACYRESRPASAAVATMLTTHRLLRTWTRMVDVYIALTNFSRNKFIEEHLPAQKVVVKPNFLHPDPGAGQVQDSYALFVGRLSVEKGVDTLTKAWGRLENRVPLKILGDGPLANTAAEASRRITGIEWLGRRPKEETLDLMSGAQFLVFPSLCYENFPLVVAEAFACGVPIIASDLGSMSSLVDHGRTGLLFRPGDSQDLADKVRWALAHPDELANMHREARTEFEAKYTAAKNYERLMSIYESVIEGTRK